jgi:hypothetical protein
LICAVIFILSVNDFDVFAAKCIQRERVTGHCLDKQGSQVAFRILLADRFEAVGHFVFLAGSLGRMEAIRERTQHAAIPAMRRRH